MKISDSEIREMAKEAGFWGVNIWWKDAIPRFRRFLELKKEQENKKGE